MSLSPQKRMLGAECASPSVKNTFVDIASFLFDNDFVTDPRKSKSLPNLHSESNIPNEMSDEHSEECDLRRHEHAKTGATSRDSSCRTADPMDDDNFWQEQASVPDPWGVAHVPRQTLEQFLQPGIPAIPFVGSHPNGQPVTYLGAQQLTTRQGRWRAQTDVFNKIDCPWARLHAHADKFDKSDCPLIAAATSLSMRVTERFPAKKGGRAFQGPSSARHSWTCRMLRNIPNDYSRNDLIQLLDSEYVQYDFAYLPLDWGKRANLGYAFVNLTTPGEAERVGRIFNGFADWTVASEKVCEVAWAKQEQQGLQLIVESFRNNPVMHPDVPDTFKPILLDSERNQLAFPAPTKALRPPRGFLRDRMHSSSSPTSTAENE